MTNELKETENQIDRIDQASTQKVLAKEKMLEDVRNSCKMSTLSKAETYLADMLPMAATFFAAAALHGRVKSAPFIAVGMSLTGAIKAKSDVGMSEKACETDKLQKLFIYGEDNK